MARFIRWQGMVAFVLLSALVSGLLYLFAESLVKSAIVSSAESAFGAEVNVADVELGYSPLQLSVLGMQVTDKETPSQNLFSFERATAGVDVWQYLFGKIIIDQLEVSQLAFSSVRSQAGKVYLNDEEMMLSNRKLEIYESNFQSYREGAVGGNNGNSGSGCGCN